MTVPFAPTWVTEVALDGEPRDLVAPARPGGGSYTRARVVARLQGDPLGYVELPLHAGRIAAGELSARLRSSLDAEIANHRPRDAVVRAGADAPFASVVVCTRDRPDTLEATLRSLQRLRYPAFEVLVVDNAPSTSATRDLVEGLGDARFRYVFERRGGHCRAKNRGAAEARGGIVAYTDDDIVADADWLATLVRGFTRAPRVGCVTGLVMTGELDTRSQALFDALLGWSDRCTPGIFDLGAHRVADPVYPWRAGIYGVGANFAVTAETLAAVGPFDEALGGGTPVRAGDDLDYFLRIVQAGLTIVNVPAALVWHHHRSTDAALRRQMWGYGTGVGAYAIKHALSRRGMREFVPVLPRGLLRVARSRARTAASIEVPRGLLAVEAAGLLASPVLYARSRRRAARA